MGLDMYLHRSSKNFDKQEYNNILKTTTYEEYEVYENQHFPEVAYWRKSNMIHNWFVENCQDGVDECQSTPVSKEKLITLRDACKYVLESKDVDTALEILPPVSGFFFGGTEIDEWYWSDLDETIQMLDKILEETDFETQQIWYQSSW